MWWHHLTHSGATEKMQISAVAQWYERLVWHDNEVFLPLWFVCGDAEKRIEKRNGSDKNYQMGVRWLKRSLYGGLEMFLMPHHAIASMSLSCRKSSMHGVQQPFDRGWHYRWISPESTPYRVISQSPQCQIVKTASSLSSMRYKVGALSSFCIQFLAAPFSGFRCCN